MEIIAHRGASALAPENTVSAYKLAWELGADAAETDVYMTRDRHLVCVHDANTRRTTGIDMDVHSAAYDTLRGLDAGSWKSPRYAGERIPLLEDVLATVPAGKRLYVEVKCGEEGLCLLPGVIRKSRRRRRVAVIGFDVELMASVKAMMPDVPVYWLRGTRKDPDTGEELEHEAGWVETAEAHHLDGLDVHFAGVTRSFAEAVHRAGMRLVVWTVNEPAVAARMRDLGVDGLTSDRVDVLGAIPQS
jgi:glycerophosphoryl diester phosphodiesterase